MEIAKPARARRQWTTILKELRNLTQVLSISYPGEEMTDETWKLVVIRFASVLKNREIRKVSGKSTLCC